MLAVKSERNEGETEMQGLSMEDTDLLDTIDFDDIFAGITDADVLPHLEIHHEILTDFSDSVSDKSVKREDAPPNSDSVSVSDGGLESPEKELENKTEEPEPEPETEPVRKPASKEAERSGKNPPSKKKAKVDWTPELHRQFVTAVEQLGFDKAVPSRILEIMGIDCLTRHNIASHLQKYRSHRKHLQAREAEAASWSRRRQIYGVGAAPTGVNHPWIAPTMGFPPAAPDFRALHVWGHPSVDQSLMYMWPKHVAPAAPPPHAWPRPPPLADPSFWHPHHQYIPPLGTLCFPPQFPLTRFSPAAADVSATKPLPKTPSDVYPSKESIDEAIGDVITKPWLPLPLGLKPPSMDSVMHELQRQGVSKLPPT